MNPFPLISIVIPTFNRRFLLKRALKSVLAQTISNWEARVVDNHSNDDTEGLIEALGDPRIKLHKTNNGGIIAISRNLGVRYAQGQFIAFLDSDDWWLPRKLEESIKQIEQGAEIIYHDLYYENKIVPRFLWKKTRARDLYRPVFSDLIENGNLLSNSSVVIKKKLLEDIGGLSEDRRLVTIEDYDAWLRVSRISENFKYIPKPLGFYGAGGQTVNNGCRAIETLDAIEERYADVLMEINKNGRVSWLTYAKGRANYLLGSYEIARKCLKLVCRWNTPWLRNLKCLYMLLMLFLIRCTRSKQTITKNIK